MPPQQQAGRGPSRGAAQGQGQAQPPTSPVDDLLRSGLDAADAVLQTARAADPKKTAEAMVQLGKAVVDTKSSLSTIDAHMQDLSKAAPGATKAISEVAQTLAKVEKVIPASNVPNGLKAPARDLQAAAKSFAKFSKDYNAYTTAPDYALFNPNTWGVKTGAALKAQSSWNDFKADFKKVEAHVPAPLKDPAVQGAARDAAGKVLDAIDQLLK